MKCCGCKRDFDKSEMTNARNEKGEYPKSSKNYYCKPCEEQEYQRKVLVEYLHRWFIYKGYYQDNKTKANKDAQGRLMKMVNTQISSLKKEGYSYIQIRLIIEYMISKENVEFNDSILGLVPFYYMKTSRYHNELHRIATSKSYGYIPPSEEEVIDRPAHKPNKKAVKVTSMDLI